MTPAMTQAGADDRSPARIHWTARASLYLSLFLFVVLPLLLNAPELFGGPLLSPLADRLGPVRYLSLFLPIPALVLSGVALVLAPRSAWRRGLEFALIGLVINVILCLESAEALWILCCFRPHIVF